MNLQIPNKEIRRAFQDEILGNIVPRQGLILCRDMLEAMASGDVAGFSEVLSEILRDFVSYHDIAQPESFRQGVSDSHDAEASVRCLYHGLMLGFSVLMEGEYRVESNRESGYGRFDIAFFPLKPGTPGVILELKSVKSEEELEETAQAALGQIGEKSYVAELARQGVKEVWNYGIAFCGKRIRMERG